MVLVMASQWECLLQNLGEWQGSFTRFSPQGEFLADTPTVVSFTGLNDNQTMRQVVRRLPLNQPVEEKVLEYSSLGKGILFFENGSFSNGSIQLAPFSEFGAEHGLIHGVRRLRLVQLFDKTGQLYQITVIRERLAGATEVERPPLQVDDLLGEWQGKGVTLYADGQPADTYPTKLQVDKNGDAEIVQQITINQGTATRNVKSTARVEGSLLYFAGGPQPNQVLLLPDGASATSPQQVIRGQAFFLELGWLLQPDLRQRLIRRYNDQGEWTTLTLVTERKVN